jgi:hypothetical protein
VDVLSRTGVPAGREQHDVCAMCLAALVAFINRTELKVPHVGRSVGGARIFFSLLLILLQWSNNECNTAPRLGLGCYDCHKQMQIDRSTSTTAIAPTAQQ